MKVNMGMCDEYHHCIAKDMILFVCIKQLQLIDDYMEWINNTQ